MALAGPALVTTYDDDISVPLAEARLRDAIGARFRDAFEAWPWDIADAVAPSDISGRCDVRHTQYTLLRCVRDDGHAGTHITVNSTEWT